MPGMRTLLTQTFKMVCNMQQLRLKRNQTGDVGFQALSTALAGGALAQVKTFSVDNTAHPVLKAACKARGIMLFCHV